MADRPQNSADDSAPAAGEPAPSSAVPSNAAANAALLSGFVAIDSCRPGSEDLQRELPSELAGAIRGNERLAARYRAVQRFDHAIAGAFDQVPLPVGLESRLLAAIAEQQAELDASRLAASASATPVELPRQATPVHTSRRRWLQICGGALASTAAGAGFLWWRLASEQPALSLEEVLHQALDFNKSGEARLVEAIPETREPAPAEFPRSRRLVGLRDVVRWRRIDGKLFGREGVAYELSAQDHLATLYVLAKDGHRGSAQLPTLADEPPLHNQPQNLVSTGGDTAGVWQEHDRIQLLVVHGDVDFYRSFLMTPGLVT